MQTGTAFPYSSATSSVLKRLQNLAFSHSKTPALLPKSLCCRGGLSLECIFQRACSAWKSQRDPLSGAAPPGTLRVMCSSTGDKRWIAVGMGVPVGCRQTEEG